MGTLRVAHPDNRPWFRDPRTIGRESHEGLHAGNYKFLPDYRHLLRAGLAVL